MIYSLWFGLIYYFVPDFWKIDLLVLVFWWNRLKCPLGTITVKWTLNGEKKTKIAPFKIVALNWDRSRETQLMKPRNKRNFEKDMSWSFLHRFSSSPSFENNWIFFNLFGSPLIFFLLCIEVIGFRSAVFAFEALFEALW